MSWFVFCPGLLIAVAALLVLARALFFLVHVDGQSMSPALEDGDRVLALRHWPARWLHKGQIVVWELPHGAPPMPGLSADGHLVIKRITGLPGDIVIVPQPELRPELRQDPGLAAMRPGEQSPQVWHIPPGHCFLKGDAFGLDSTALGPLPFHCLRGVVLAKLWRHVRRQAHPQTPPDAP